jgi:hypothetical protein
MPQLAAGALMFLRGDVCVADTTVERTYTLGQMRESLHMLAEEKPYYTPGFLLSLVFQHKMRIGTLDGPPTASLSVPEQNPIMSDTSELAWHTSSAQTGLISVDAPRSQALIGFVAAYDKTTQHLEADVTNAFCAITLTALDTEPIVRPSCYSSLVHVSRTPASSGTARTAR